ncbi:MAG: hypothetical protein A3F75_12445 [Betaproteobacteria bacterium RIFCSPLOWO2_12_FULL_64_23]|nr:MAG: hypothetical protein A3F75_12445 [Betaproteobacteria bacterium RIFCSPLOWO2_12_FULL_64_23]
MQTRPNLSPRATERRIAVAPASFPLLLPGAMSIEGDRRCGDRRRLGFISHLDLFQGVSYSAVEDVLADCPVRRFAADELLLEPGVPNSNVFLVVEGRLRVHLDSVESGNAIFIEAGGCIGEMSIIDGKPVSAFVVAEKDSRILVLDQEQFWSRIVTDVRVVRNLLQLLTERMRRNNEAVLKGLKERLILEHIQKELRFAHEIQEGMLPRNFGLPGLAHRVDLHASMQAAREIGGDLYDFFVMPQGGVCVLVGDVSDKGMPAALFMARTVVIVQMVARLIAAAGGGAPEPAAILSEVNRALWENNPSRMFVTMFLAILDPRTGALSYSNAGHNSPYVRSPDGTLTALDGMRGAPLGIKPALSYRSGVTQLRDGDMLFAYTDGVTEAADPGDGMFGEARLERVLREANDHDAAALTGAVLGAVRRFAGDAIQSDDITMLALRLLPGA